MTAKQQVEVPDHIEALVASKREARQHRGVNRLTRAVPACRDLLVQAAERGDNIGSLSAALLRLLDRYGAADLRGGGRTKRSPPACRTRTRCAWPGTAARCARQSTSGGPGAAGACAARGHAGAAARARQLRSTGKGANDDEQARILSNCAPAL